MKYAKKLLSVSLNYDHVLYCMDNETGAEEEWAIYWAELVKKEAGSKTVNVTEMWNDKKGFLGEHHRRTIDHPERYGFIDISQNTWIEGQQNWQNARKVMDYIKDQPRPVNSTKIYGNDISSHNSYRTTQHAIQTFFRNIVGGFASSRFHRPTGGIGLSPVSVNCIKSIRLAETKVKFWELAPRMDLLADCEENEAYLTASEGESYLLYFTGEGAVRLDVRQQKGTFSVRVMDVQNPEWKEKYTIEGGKRVVMQRFYQPDYVENAVAASLTAYDLPDLAAVLVPRKLLLLDVMDGKGHVADTSSVGEDMDIIRQAYSHRKAKNQLMIETEGLGERHLLKEWMQ